jgi:two-component SAPR family response regulator
MMPELTGINFMKIVGDKQKYILTTAYSEYALEGYEHNIIDYLLKPISFERFQKKCCKGSGAVFFQTEESTHFLSNPRDSSIVSASMMFFISKALKIM